MDKYLIDSNNEPLKLGKIVGIREILEQRGYKFLYLEDPFKISETILDEQFNKSCEFGSLVFEEGAFTKKTYYQHKEIDFYLTVDKGIISQVIYKYNNDDIDKVLKFLNKLEKDSASKVMVIIKSRFGFELSACDLTILDLDLSTMYNDDFIKTSDHIVSKLKTENKGIVMLHGDPGTGKTNYIKWLTSQVDKKFLFIPNNLIGEIIDPSFISFMMGYPNSVLILEDCEGYIKERGVQERDVVSSILNISDGILSDVLKFQIICTFNSKLTAIDTALLRKGRLIANYEFKELELQKVIKLSEKLGINVPENKTLASIFNSVDNFGNDNEKKKIGF